MTPKLTVTLINPSFIENSNSAAAMLTMAPLGLAYIAAALSDICNLVVIDGLGEGLLQRTPILNKKQNIIGLNIDEIIEKIPEDSHIIAMTCMFTSLWWYHKIILDRIINKHPNAQIVLGGENITADFESIIKQFSSKIICVLGEGEETIAELVTAITEKTDLNKISGIAYRDETLKIIHSRRKRLLEIDKLKWPRWDFFPIPKYLEHGSGLLIHKRSMGFLTSRGCPFNCMFCSAPNMWTNKMTYRTPENVISEIKTNIEKYQINNVEFLDLVGIIHKPWIEKFIELYKKNNLNISIIYSPGTRSEILDMDLLIKLKEINIVRILFAPDSGSQKEAKRIKKNINFKKLQRSIRDCVKINIPSRASIVVGFPDQTLFELFESYLFAIKLTVLGVNDVQIFNFVPYAGSEFNSKLKIKLNQSSINIDQSPSASLGLVKSYSQHIPDSLLSISRTFTLGFCIILGFLLRPFRIYTFFKNLITKQPITALENLIYLKFLYRKKLYFKPPIEI